MAKPSPTGLPVNEIVAALEEMGDFQPVFIMIVRTLFMQELRDKGEISNVEMIFADFEQYVSSAKGGDMCILEHNAIMERRRDLPSVLVPLWYLETLVACFHSYAAADGGVTFGEAFKLEGGGQGARKRVSKLSEIIRDMRVCDQILAIRVAAEKSGAPVSLEQAYAQLSLNYEAHGTPLGEATIRRAYRKYGDLFTSISLELLIGGISS